MFENTTISTPHINRSILHSDNCDTPCCLRKHYTCMPICFTTWTKHWLQRYHKSLHDFNDMHWSCSRNHWSNSSYHFCGVRILSLWFINSLPISLNVHLCLILALASCATLLAVTVERYISVAHPLRYALVVTVRRSKIVVQLIWLLHGLLAVILISVVHPLYDNKGRFDPDYLTCFDREKITKEFFYYIALFEIIPCFSIVFMYSRMLMIAHQNSVSIRHLTLKRFDTAEVDSQARRNYMISKCSAAMTFFLVTTASIVAWLPFTAVIFQESIMERSVESHWKFLSVIFLFSGSWFNVVINYFRNSQFR